MDRVHTQEFEHCKSWLKTRENGTCITFSFTNPGGEPCRLSGYEMLPPGEQYRVNAVLSLWKKDHLLYYLQAEESAWEFEQKGTLRSWDTDDEFYIFEQKTPGVFPYDFARFGLFCGQWLPATVNFLERENIPIDFSKRGFYDEALRGMTNSTRQVMCLDSAVIAYYDHPIEGDPYQRYSGETIKQGAFHQQYDISGASEVLYWELSTLWGFRLSGLEIMLTYQNGTQELVAPDQYMGNYIRINDVLIFNSTEPKMFIFPSSKNKLASLEIKGMFDYEDDAGLLKVAYNANISMPFNTLDRKIKFYMQCYMSTCKMRDVRLRSKLRQKNKAWQIDTNIIPRGSFCQRYRLNPSASKHIIWKISEDNAFTVKNLDVVCITDSGEQLALCAKNAEAA